MDISNDNQYLTTVSIDGIIIIWKLYQNKVPTIYTTFNQRSHNIEEEFK